LKNFLVLFSFSIIILSAISSSAFIKKDNKRKAQFMQKFEQTYKFDAKSSKKVQADKRFLELFEKVSKK
jgi:cell fate (sporulation/competence/biofilm development) regulator YlbF (YheA/YmcA/DUF963 family)